MNRSILLFSLASLAGAALLLSCSGGGSTTRISTPPPLKIKHVVVIFQENRTSDNLFQDQKLIAAAADIVSRVVNSNGQTIPLSEIDLGTNGTNPDYYDLSHAHIAFTEMCDLDAATNLCKMDGANLITVTCAKVVTNCAPSNPQFIYVNPTDAAPYFQIAEQYTFAERMFQRPYVQLFTEQNLPDFQGNKHQCYLSTNSFFSLFADAFVPA